MGAGRKGDESALCEREEPRVSEVISRSEWAGQTRDEPERGAGVEREEAGSATGETSIRCTRTARAWGWGLGNRVGFQ